MPADACVSATMLFLFTVSRRDVKTRGQQVRQSTHLLMAMVRWYVQDSFICEL